MKSLATMLLMALLASGHAAPQPCRKDGVEWLLGGVAAACASNPLQAPHARSPDATATAARQRISGADQLGRDEERASILRQELREAQASLAQLQAGADAATRQRLRADIEALHKEISRLPAALRSVR